MVLVNYILATIGMMSTSLIFFHNAPDNLAAFLGFWAWTLIPYLLLLIVNQSLRQTITTQVLVTLESVIVVPGAFFIYWYGFYSHPDALSGILFIVLPLYQIMLILFISLIAVGQQAISKMWKERK